MEVEAPRPRWHVNLLDAGLGLAFAVLVIRYFQIAGSSFSYDEATYVELARHPWRSSYYPDAFFARHPPLAFVVLGIWTNLFGESEAVARLPSLLCSLAATIVFWRAARDELGANVGGAAAFLVGANLLTLVYGLQATLYPYAFLAAAFLAHATLSRNTRRQGVAIALLALTHLFGFLFLVLWLWRHRREWKAHPVLALPVLWLLASVALVVLLRNRAGPGLGPLWQPTRLFEFPYQLWVGDTTLALHLLAFAVLLLLLNPLMVARAWRRARARDPIAIAVVVLVVFLLTGPTFLRFGLVLLPIVAAMGLDVLWSRPGRIATGAIFVVGLAAGALFLSTGVEPRAQNDVPGLVDWRGPSDFFHESNATAIYASSPTALAYYLEVRHDARVVNATQGPDVLPMRRSDGRIVEVRMLPASLDLPDGADAVVAIGRQRAASFDEPGFHECHRARGLVLFCPD